MGILDVATYPPLLASMGVAIAAVDLQRAWPVFVVAAILALLYRYREMLLTTQRPRSKVPMRGWVTIPQGERWNVCMTSGKIRTVSGPSVIRVWGATLEQLQQFSATHAQYLYVQFLDGSSQIIPGPTTMHMDSSIHKVITVKDAVNLTDGELLVVYRNDDIQATAGEGKTSGNEVARHIIRGPCLHVPKNASEWTHQFSWHGSVSNDPALNGRKVKGGIKFTKLRTNPEQTYFDVENVRTRDDALVTIKVMIFYRLKDIETMLRETHDPTADFINSLSSDVIDFIAGKTFEEFKGVTDQLNNLSVYQQLTSRAVGIGFEVTKVVFRGYGAPQRLQQMHDDAIGRRTKLALDRENEEQEQRLQDMKLEREEARQRQRQRIECEAKTHERELQRAEHETSQERRREERKAQLEHLVNMKKALDLSGDQFANYLLAQEQGPPSKLVQILHKDSDSREGASHGSFIQISDQA